ncbi:hypothetical protein TNCV_5135571 [Trichonephila clavipes]|nr:hypothetical protein TNCV_5135571 [Trichonephila clavipes]
MWTEKRTKDVEEDPERKICARTAPSTFSSLLFPTAGSSLFAKRSFLITFTTDAARWLCFRVFFSSRSRQSLGRKKNKKRKRREKRRNLLRPEVWKRCRCAFPRDGRDSEKISFCIPSRGSSERWGREMMRFGRRVTRSFKSRIRQQEKAPVMTICLSSLLCVSRFLKRKDTFIAIHLQVDNKPAALVVRRPYLSFNTLPCYTCVQKGCSAIVMRWVVYEYVTS